jgi:hypothetical protein
LELCHLWSEQQKERLKLKGKSLLNNFLSAKQSISDISHALQNQAEEAKKLIEEAKHFSIERHKKGIRIPSMHRNNLVLNLLIKSILLIIGLPYFAASALVSSPVTLLSEWICSKTKDPAFHNSIRFLMIAFLHPLVLLVISITSLSVLRWYWALAAITLAVPTVIYVYDYLRWVRLFISDIKWLINKELRDKFHSIIKLI